MNGTFVRFMTSVTTAPDPALHALLHGGRKELERAERKGFAQCSLCRIRMQDVILFNCDTARNLDFVVQESYS
jgi:hypothetical protein